MNENLSTRAAQGDPKAFGDYCQRNRQTLLLAAQQIVGPSVAEDLLQEALLECYVKISELREPTAILAWIRGTIRNRCYNYLRAHRTVAFPNVRLDQRPAETPTPLSELETLENREQILQALSNLSEKNRRATELFYLEDRSVHEVAQILGISSSATRVRLSRSRILLKDLLFDVYTSGEQEISMARTQSDPKLRCSFCGTSIEKLQLLVTGPGVNICSSCVQACVQVMIKKHGFSVQLAQQPTDEVMSRVSADL